MTNFMFPSSRFKGYLFLFIGLILLLFLLGRYVFDKRVHVVFAGDTALGVSALGEKTLLRYGQDAPFTHVKQILIDADFVIGNLETPIVDASIKTVRNYEVPRQIPGVERTFATQKFYGLSLANNHAMDYGDIGLAQTISRLERAGVKTFGAGSDLDHARKPLILEKNGIRIGILGVCHPYRNHEHLLASKTKAGVAYLDPEMLSQDIRQLKKQVDFVVVFPHWGNIFKPINGEQRRYARAAVKAGADLIIGHHPHIPQEVETYRGIPILYSLGNFVFHGIRSHGYNKTLDKDYSIVADVTFSKAGIKSIALTPFFNNNRKTNFTPRVVSKQKAQRLFEKLLLPLHDLWKIRENTAFLNARLLKAFSTRDITPLTVIGTYFQELPKLFPAMAMFFGIGAMLTLPVTLWIRKKSWSRNLSRLGLAAVLVIGIGNAWMNRALMDDAFISFRYARNFIQGNGLVFNVGEKVEGYTNFLWTLLVAIVSWISGIRLPVVGFFGSLICFAACLTTICCIGRRLRDRDAKSFYFPIAACWLAAQYTFFSFGTTGLETMFATLLVCLGAGFALGKPTSQKAFVSATFLILATMTRPDHGLFYACMGAAFGLYYASALIHHRKDRLKRKEVIHNGVKIIGAYALPFVGYLGYLGWKMTYYDAILPNTYWAKSADKTYWNQGAIYAVEFGLTSHLIWLLPVFFLWAILTTSKRLQVFKTFCVFSTVLYTFYIIKIGGDFMEGRFFVPLMPLILLGLENGSYKFMKAKKYHPVIVALIIAILATLTVRAPLLPDRKVKWFLADENTYYPLKSLFPIKIGARDKRENMAAAPKRLKKAFVDHGLFPVIGAGGIGLTGYYSQLPLIDIRGLTDSYVSHLPIRERRRPGHEKSAPEAYLDARGVRIARGHPKNYIAGISRLKIDQKPISFFYLYRYDVEWMHQVEQKSPEVNFTNFPQWLDTKAVSFLKQHPLEVAKRLCAYDHYYFSLNHDSKRRAVFENRFIRLVDFENGQLPPGTIARGVFENSLVRPVFDGDYDIRNYQGETLVATSKNGIGDLRLPRFEITGDVLGFLIGGASHQDFVSVTLEIDDKPVRTATGRQVDGLDFASWNVTEFKGKYGQIIVRDSSNKHRAFFDMLFEADRIFSAPNQHIEPTLLDLKAAPHEFVFHKK